MSWDARLAAEEREGPAERICMACELTFSAENWLAEWWAHMGTDEHEAMARSPEGRRRIDAYWAEKDAEAARDEGLLF